jgi:hypothetical protein
MKASAIAEALTTNHGPFSRRRWFVVPNVSWGWSLSYEADIIAVSAAGWANEIEIKVNKYDLRGDKNKSKFKVAADKRIKRFWYAIPLELLDEAMACLPADVGIITISPGKYKTSNPVASIARSAENRKGARKVTDKELQKLLHLGVMRYWDIRLKEAE